MSKLTDEVKNLITSPFTNLETEITDVLSDQNVPIKKIEEDTNEIKTLNPKSLKASDNIISNKDKEIQDLKKLLEK